MIEGSWVIKTPVIDIYNAFQDNLTATTVIQTVMKDGLVIKTTFAARSVIKKKLRLFLYQCVLNCVLRTL